EGYHLVGRIPVFGSDHRAFAAAGIPAYGFTIVPFAEADALRQFVFSPMRSALRALVRRPVPFDTYHTPRDAFATLEPAALERVDDVGVRRGDHAVGTPDLEVLVVAHLCGEEVVLDEDDGQAPLPAGVDDASDGGEQSPRIERIGQGGIVLEEPLEEIDDED